MTTKMMDALKVIGKEWHKDNMHRFYINLTEADKLYRDMETAAHGSLPCNRRERENGKVWIDLDNDEISTKGIQCNDDMIDAIRELIAYLCPAEETSEEESSEENAEETSEETNQKNLWYAIQRDREDDWGTGTYDRDEAIRRLKESDGYYTLIAVIDKDLCIGEITMADL